MDEDFSVSRAILKAGGFSDFADRKHVKITRKKSPTDRDNQVIIVDVTEIWEKGKTEKDVKLEPGDLLFIPARLVNF